VGATPAHADYSSSVSGTTATFDGDASGDVLRVGHYGGYLTNNRGTEGGDPGYDGAGTRAGPPTS
jgi:hypothetical protein